MEVSAAYHLLLDAMAVQDAALVHGKASQHKRHESELNPCMTNYESAEFSADQFEAHFRADEVEGCVIPKTLATSGVR